MPEGKFIKRLEEVSGGVAPAMGFKAATVAPPPAMLLAVALPAVDAQHAAAAIDGGAEAIIVRVGVQDEKTLETPKLQEILDAAQGKPCGIVPVGSGAHELERLKQMQSLGFDFAIMSGHDDPHILHLDDFGKVLIIDSTFDNDLIRTINDLDVGAVEVSLARPEAVGRHFSIGDLMHYKLLRMLVRKPMIVRGERSVRPEDVSGLFDVGIEGLIIDAGVTGSGTQSIRDATAAYRDAIAQLEPRKRGKSGKMTATIPFIKPPQPFTQEEEPEEPDEQ